jgi:dipeptidyl aminopeptidase/acylaminoacyl peptidase
LTSAATCPNGEIMAVGSVDEINIIDLNTGNTTLTLATQGAQHKIRFSDDGRYLAVVTKKPESFGSQTNILDLDDHGKVIQSVDGWDAVLSPNSKYVAFRDSGFIYQIGSNDHGLSTENLNLQFLNDSRAIIERRTATTPQIGLFEIYDVENERRLSRLDIHSDGYRSVWAASPDGTLVAKWEDKSIVVYNTTTGQQQSTLHSG